ncbi:MAG: hypothetical protein WA957_01230 [Alteraurantiacibacter sp.]
MTTLLIAIISSNVKTVAEKTGTDHVLWMAYQRLALLVDRLFDPYFLWPFWLAVGVIIGQLLSTWGDKAEVAQRERKDGPSFRYLKLQAAFVRLGIRHRWIAKIGGAALNKALENLAIVLPQKHGLAPLPARNFEAKEKRLRQTSEYLRKVRHHLNDRDIVDARLLSWVITKR